MNYRVTTYYWDEPSISEDFDLLDEATEAMQSTDEAARFAPVSVAGDIRGCNIRHIPSNQIIRKASYGSAA